MKTTPNYTVTFGDSFSLMTLILGDERMALVCEKLGERKRQRDVERKQKRERKK